MPEAIAAIFALGNRRLNLRRRQGQRRPAGGEAALRAMHRLVGVEIPQQRARGVRVAMARLAPSRSCPSRSVRSTPSAAPASPISADRGLLVVPRSALPAASPKLASGPASVTTSHCVMTRPRRPLRQRTLPTLRLSPSPARQRSAPCRHPITGRRLWRNRAAACRAARSTRRQDRPPQPALQRR